jgi:hypothetical protein
MHHLIHSPKFTSSNKEFDVSTKTLNIILVGVIVLGVTLFLLDKNQSSALEEYPGPKWEYLEVSFDQPLTFMSPLSGYYENGNFITPTTPGTTMASYFRWLGTGRGWELIFNNNNQYFIFKRPALRE